MEVSEDNFLQLEQQVLDMLLLGDDSALAALRVQLELADRSRNFSGVGFFTDFAVPAETPRILGNPSIRFGDVIAEIAGLQHGAGFVLFIDDGFLTMLEGYSYDEPWPASIASYQLSYWPKPSRDFDYIRALPGWPKS